MALTKVVLKFVCFGFLLFTCELIAKRDLSQSLFMSYSLKEVFPLQITPKNMSLTHIQIIFCLPYFEIDDLNVILSALAIWGPMSCFGDGLPYAH